MTATIREIFEQLDSVRRNEACVAMVTLVATKGTTPKKEGAKMWVGEGGRIAGSVTIGGCVDARVIEESEEVLATGRPKLLSIELGDEDAWELGLTCSGTIDVLVERIDLRNADEPALRAYAIVRADVEERNRHAASVQLLDGRGERLVVREDGTSIGTLGSSDLDRHARDQALELMRRGRSARVELGVGTSARAAFVETHGPPSTLVVVGAGNIAVPLVRLAKHLGLRTLVIDGRPRFATRERFPDADDVLVGIPSEIVASLPLASNTLVVLVAHDYKYDLPVLRAILRSDAGYIGMLGSRRRGRAILDFLAAEGEPPEALERIHVPVGLNIGAQTAAEIALSILAEAVAVRAGRPGTPMRDGAGQHGLAAFEERAHR
jgi:xanthine dehydrogenase accessory factor